MVLKIHTPTKHIHYAYWWVQTVVDDEMETFPPGGIDQRLDHIIQWRVTNVRGNAGQLNHDQSIQGNRHICDKSLAFAV